MDGVRARNLPKDVEGPVRVIRIDGQRDNMCCGTHVSNLSQLQSIKLLFAEKTKTGINVHFVAGLRVIKRLGDCFQREQQLNLAFKYVNRVFAYAYYFMKNNIFCFEIY